jgi:hypothetical protein
MVAMEFILARQGEINMGCKFICDGCGQEAYGFYNGRAWNKPRMWYAKNVEYSESNEKVFELIACCLDCVEKASEKFKTDNNDMALKTQYKYIEFIYDGENKLWWCMNRKHKDELGAVRHYPGWKQWVFSQRADEGIILSHDCLTDIADFLQQLNKEKP